MAKAQYKIAPIPNPNTADTTHPTVFDYWPVCYDPNHMPSAANADPATGFDPVAAGWGATGGLREAAFIEEFGENGMKFSICQPDFADTMSAIGNTLAGKMQNLCLDYKLLDGDLTMAGLQPDCDVHWERLTLDPQDPTKVVYVYDPAPLPFCPPGAYQGNVAQDCWALTSNKGRCPVNGQVVTVLRTAEEIAHDPQVPAGTRIRMHCRVCLAGSTAPGCAY